jgi:formylmethanofuran dehydrogenase subunit E
MDQKIVESNFTAIERRIDLEGLSPSMKDYFKQVIEFHTYPAPGLLMGVFMVDYALDLLNARPGEKLYAVCETIKCLPDTLQVIAHCTIGNHRLRVFPIGRFAITMNRPSEEEYVEGFRVYVDRSKLKPYPTLASWYVNEPGYDARAQHTRLIDEIFKAGRDILSFERVMVKVTPKQKWSSAACQVCGELVPEDLLENGVCGGCKPDAYYKKNPGN